MPILTQPAFGPKVSIAFITGGALLDVWVAVWYYAFVRPQPGPMTSNQWFWVTGLFLTGLTFVVIGLTLGHIGRAARRAEMPPDDETTRAETHVQAKNGGNATPVAAAPVAAPAAAPPVSPPTAQVVQTPGVVPTTAVVPGQPAPGVVR